MIKFRLKTPAGDVQVSLDVAKKNDAGPLLFEGEPKAVAMVKEWLVNALDDRGHAIGSTTTPHRLRWAMLDRRAGLHVAEVVEDDIDW
jgi:hypothetical protein